ncbi:MAG: hypothetical protein ACUVXD_10745, partial [Thermodesulfobacteriota bacterium]
MTETTKCKVCNENEATEKCAICGIELCELCKKVVQTEDISASHRVKGVSTEGVLGPAQKRVTVCAKCMAETDFFEKEEHEKVEKEEVREAPRERLRPFKGPGKGMAVEKVGDLEVDLTEITPDIRGREELVRSILR